MKIITTTSDLAAFCKTCAAHPYVTVDTEFLRERTYYSQLCLVQMAHPGTGDQGAVLIDTLSPELDLSPMYELFENPKVVKVFHAARQDLEIFYVDRQIIPKPFFDTQVAAMVCGFGEQVGYETLVRKIANAPLDKSSRFTDWSHRPLSDKQKIYALRDVTHLRVIYEQLCKQLEKSNRLSWVNEELEVLTNPQTYDSDPKQAWKRVKTRKANGKTLAIVRELAEFREALAQKRDIPRGRVLKDEAIMELAATKPGSFADLGKSRLLLREARKGEIADGILAAVERGVNTPPDQYPELPETFHRQPGTEALSDLLRVLLKAKAEEFGVAQKLIASAAQLDELASGHHNPLIFKGWRHQVFGQDAERLIRGEIALSADGSAIRIIPLSHP